MTRFPSTQMLLGCAMILVVGVGAGCSSKDENAPASTGAPAAGVPAPAPLPAGPVADGAAAGEAYLAKNKTVEGVTVTASGLQIQTITEGTGKKPVASDSVTVNYKGTLIDGTKFDSSYDRGEPATFPLGGVIPGWTEGLQLMKLGGKYKLTIPSNLAYGSNPRPGGPIPPNAVLVFEIDLLAINGQK